MAPGDTRALTELVAVLGTALALSGAILWYGWHGQHGQHGWLGSRFRRR